MPNPSPSLDRDLTTRRPPRAPLLHNMRDNLPYLMWIHHLEHWGETNKLSASKRAAAAKRIVTAYQRMFRAYDRFS